MEKSLQWLWRSCRLKVLADGRTDNRQKVITIAHPEHNSGELKSFCHLNYHLIWSIMRWFPHNVPHLIGIGQVPKWPIWLLNWLSYQQQTWCLVNYLMCLCLNKTRAWWILFAKPSLKTWVWRRLSRKSSTLRPKTKSSFILLSSSTPILTSLLKRAFPENEYKSKNSWLQANRQEQLLHPKPCQSRTKMRAKEDLYHSPVTREAKTEKDWW